MEKTILILLYSLSGASHLFFLIQEGKNHMVNMTAEGTN